ncbi:hypothetical protein MN032_10930 [Agromyces atrinae]|uniref:hypothetical protein n=1 Tax=Agromyces atrinae TaxID=592376 RepID=UPI001F57D199|nr:hypothetical protein [Agromyces atrinae]MCI2958211.1 hypothetical protein [Agromyces atrinae]
MALIDSRIHGTTELPISAIVAPITTANPLSIPELYWSAQLEISSPAPAAVALFEFAEELTRSVDRPAIPDTVAVHVDPTHGHIAVEVEQREGARRDPIVFVDLGSVLNVWSWQGGNLSPATARELGAALTAWADKKEAKE